MKSCNLQALAISLLFMLLLSSFVMSCHPQQAIGSLQAGSLSSWSSTADAARVGQQTMIFQDGVSPDGSYAGTTDLILASDANENANLGGMEHIEVYFADSEARRSLMRWDLSALPDEVTIKSATVDLYRYDGKANSEMVLGLYRLTGSWVEGSGDDFFPAPSYLPDGATWMTTDGSTSWVNAGGDYDPSLIASLTLPAAMANGWISLDATEAVRAWVDGLPNYGLLLRPQSGDYSYHYFYSRNGQIGSQRPRLVINYTIAPPSPTTTALPVTATATGKPASGLLYLPLIVRAAAETPTATPTALTNASPTPIATMQSGSLPTESRIYPIDFVYQGAFRLPNETSNNSSWSYGGSGMTFYPAGDPANTDDYPGSLFSIGHPYEGLVSEFSIPVPVISPNKEINDLPIATTLQPFAELTNGQQNGDLTGLILGDIQYYPRQGSQSSDKLYWVMYQYYQPLDEIGHGWSEMDMSNPQSQGNWRLADFPTAATNEYLFEIPRRWAERYTPGQYLVAGRQRAVNNGSWGAALYAFGPWNDGNPPSNGSAVAATQLLYYPWGDEANGIADHANKDFSYFDSWEDGAWLSQDDRAGVMLAGLKSLRTLHGPVYEYYGLANIDGCSDKGYHAEPYTGAIQLYDPTLLAAVAQGMLESYQIQPYALFNPEDFLFQQGCRTNTLGGVGYDRERGIVYIIEKVVLADEAKAIVHVFRLAEQAQAPDFTPPTAPTNLQLDNATANEVTFRWDAASDNTHLVGYIIYRYGEPIATTTENQYTDDKVNPNASYTYTVVAWDSSSNLSPPTHLTVNSPPGGADSRVPIISNIKYSALSDTSMTINWQTDEPASTVFTYTIEYSGNELLYEDNTLTTNHQATLTNLTPEGNYYIPAFVSSDAAGNRNAFSSESWGFTTSPAGSQLNFRPFLKGIGAQRLQVGESLTLTLQGLDRDADDILTLSAINLPAEATFEPATGQFSWTAKAAGTYQMTFTVSDGDQSDSEQVTVFVMGE